MKSKTFDKEFDDNKVDIIGDLDLFTNLVKTSVAFCTTVLDSVRQNSGNIYCWLIEEREFSIRMDKVRSNLLIASGSLLLQSQLKITLTATRS